MLSSWIFVTTRTFLLKHGEKKHENSGSFWVKWVSLGNINIIYIQPGE